MRIWNIKTKSDKYFIFVRWSLGSVLQLLLMQNEFLIQLIHIRGKIS